MTVRHNTSLEHIPLGPASREDAEAEEDLGAGDEDGEADEDDDDPGEAC